MRTIITATLFGFIVTLSACDSGGDEKAAKTAKTDKKADDAAKPGDGKKAAPAAGDKAPAPGGDNAAPEGDKPAAGEGDKPAAAEGDKPAAAEAAAAALDPKVDKAVKVANKIATNPDATDTILSEAGLDRESFEVLLYEIARDPALSESYSVAREAS